MDLRRRSGLEAAAEAVQTGRGQRTMDALLIVLQQLQDKEQQFLVARDKSADQHEAQSNAVLIVGTALGLLIAAAAGWSALRDSSKRGYTEEALRDSEEEYRMLLDGVQDNAIFMLDPAGKSSAGIPAPSGSRATAPRRSSVSTFPVSFSTTTSSGACRRKFCGSPTANGVFEEQGMRMRKDGTRYLASCHLHRACATRPEICGDFPSSVTISARATKPARNIAACWRRRRTPWWW